MNGKEFIKAVDTVEKEKGIDREIIFEAMENDSVINQGLDILADYTTQNESDEPFYLDYPFDDSLPEEQTLVLQKKFDELS